MLNTIIRYFIFRVVWSTLGTLGIIARGTLLDHSSTFAMYIYKPVSPHTHQVTAQSTHARILTGLLVSRKLHIRSAFAA